jgi:molecular chaperone DnaK
MKHILLLDVTPLTLGIKVEGGLMAKLIPRNTAIPTKKSQIFSTAADNQTGVTVEVYQGERPMADDNRKLGQFDLTGIPPAPRGVPQIEVTFDIDANGILHVSAKDLATGKEQQIKITATTGLSEADIQRMVKEAEQFADKDRQRQELAEARNQAEHAIYSTEKMLREQGDKVSSADRERVGAAIEKLRRAKEGGTLQEIRQEPEGLTRITHEISRALYEEAARRRTEASPSGGGEKVIDAEFRTRPEDERRAG